MCCWDTHQKKKQKTNVEALWVTSGGGKWINNSTTFLCVRALFIYYLSVEISLFSLWARRVWQSWTFVPYFRYSFLSGFSQLPDSLNTLTHTHTHTLSAFLSLSHWLTLVGFYLYPIPRGWYVFSIYPEDNIYIQNRINDLAKISTRLDH